MSSIFSTSDHRTTRLLNYLGTGLLVALVVLLAWLQFRWLTQLSQEEEFRRRVALEVAATNYGEHISRELGALVERLAQERSPTELLAQEPLLDAIVYFSTDGLPRISTRRHSEPHPAGWAEVQQRLGRPLIRTLLAGIEQTGLWLDPPAVVLCLQVCRAASLSRTQLAERLLAPAARRMFADFGEELNLTVSSEGGGPDALLFARGARQTGLQVTDLQQAVLRDVAVLGPADRDWFVSINHGGLSLEATVTRSHARNVLLSLGVLSLLIVSIALVISNARRQAALAREQLYFVAGVSHELRTPLAVISSAADNLADCAVLEEERVARYGELIRTEARRLASMIENVLQFAQSASASRPRTQTAIDAGELIKRVLDEKRPLLEDRELRPDIPAGLPTIVGDPAALESALANLVVNAARYARGGNWISIVARAVRVRPRGHALRISISNPVVEKPDPHPERLFEPFYRGRNVRSGGPAGTGIGLAVARNIARQHGGGITIDAAREGIITFTLFLPVHESEPSTPAAG